MDAMHVCDSMCESSWGPQFFLAGEMCDVRRVSFSDFFRHVL